MTESHDEQIKRPILLQLGVVLLCLFIAFLGGIYLLQDRLILWHAGDHFTGLDSRLTEEFDSEAEILASLLTMYTESPQLRQAFVDRDRDRLLRLAMPVFTAVSNSRNPISHFYFYTPEKRVFLRVHRPDRFGDTVARQTLDRAAATGEVSHGIELGRYGTLTLRVVQPMVMNGRRIGYVEFGREIEYIAPWLKHLLGADLVFWADKSLLSREDWDAGRKIRRFQGDWNRFPGHVAVDSTLGVAPQDLGAHLRPGAGAMPVGEIFPFSLAERQYRGMILVLRDAARQEIGKVCVLMDVTAEATSLHSLLWILMLTSLILWLGLLLFFSRLLGRIDQRLLDSRAALTREIEIRRLREQELEGFGRLLEDTVATRTADLARTVAEKDAEIVERRRIEEEKQRNYELQSAVSQLLTIALQDLPLEGVLQQALDLILSISALTLEQRGAIFLVEGDPETLVLKVQNGLAGALLKVCARVDFGTCICGRAAQSRQAVFAAEIDDRHDVRYAGILPHGHYCVPIVVGNCTLGVIALYLEEHHERNQREIDFLTAIANTLAGIIVRRRAEERVAAAEERYRVITATTLDGIIVMDDRGLISFFNPAAAAMFGYSEAEVLGRDLHQILASPRYLDAAMPAVHAFGETGQGEIINQTTEMVGVRRDGSEFPLELSLGRIALGERWGAVGVVRDITKRRQEEQERAQLQAQFLQAQKMEAVGQLAGGVAHDFNNLLTGIIGFSELTMDSLEEGTAQHSDMGEILRLSKKAADVVRQLLAFSRRQPMEPRLLNMNELVAGLTKMLRRLIGEDIEFEFRPADEIDPVMADPGQIEQVLVNLVVNARHAMAEGGRLFLTIENTVLDKEKGRMHHQIEVIPGRYVRLTVTDSGCGMKRAVCDRIFDPFFTTKKEGEGTGLGLSSAYGIIKQHRGYIWVYSEVGRGTCFKIYLPVFKKSGETIPHDEDAAPAGGAETILVVDDDEGVSSIVQRQLRQLGYTALIAGNTEEAEAMAATDGQSIDLLLTDMVMPRLDGPELYQRCLRHQPDMKVVFMSGYPSQALADRHLLQADAPFISKPFSKTAIDAKLREVLDG